MIAWVMIGMLFVAVIWLVADVLQGLRAIDRKERYTPLPIEIWREFALSLEEPERTQMLAREWFILTDDDLAAIRHMSSVSSHQ